MIVKTVELLRVGDRLPYDPAMEPEPFIEQACHTLISVRHIDGTYPVKIIKRVGDEIRWEIDYYGHTIQAAALVGSTIVVYPEDEHGDQASPVFEAGRLGEGACADQGQAATAGAGDERWDGGNGGRQSGGGRGRTAARDIGDAAAPGQRG